MTARRASGWAGGLAVAAGLAALAGCAQPVLGGATGTRVTAADTTRTPPPAAAGSSHAAARSTSGTVVAVIDGDTIVVDVHGRARHVRLLGINAPEIPHRRYGAAGQCGGQAARVAADRLLYRRHVVLTTDPREATVDRYGRWLRYVSVGGRDAQLVLLEGGHASEYHPASARTETRAGEYAAAERAARAARVGQWRTCDAAAETKAPPHR